MPRVLISIGLLQVLTMLVGLLRAKGLSVLLGPAGFGIVSTIDQVVLTLVYLGALGLPFTALRFMARSHSEGLEHFHRAGAGFTRVLGAMALLTTALALAVLAWRPAIFGADLVRYDGFLRLALLGIPATMLSILFVNVLAAARRPAAAAGLNLIALLALALAALLGVSTNGIAGLYVGTFIAGVATTVAAAAYLRATVGFRVAGESLPLVRESPSAPGMLSASGYIYLALLAYSFGLLGVRYVVFSILGERPAGLLHASLSVALAVGAVLGPLNNLYLTPLVHRDVSSGEKAMIANDFAGKTLLLLLLGALPVVLFPHVLLSLLFTSEFAVAAATVSLFVLWQCLAQVGNVYQQLLVGLNDVRFVALALVASYAIATMLALVLVPMLGLRGAPMSLSLGMLLYGSVTAVRLRHRFRVPIPRQIVLRSSYVCVVVLLAGALFGGTEESSLRAMGARIAFAAVTLALCWVLLDSDERRLLRDGPSAVRRLLGARGRTASSPAL